MRRPGARALLYPSARLRVAGEQAAHGFAAEDVHVEMRHALRSIRPVIGDQAVTAFDDAQLYNRFRTLLQIAGQDPGRE